jgi:hypothetical protein
MLQELGRLSKGWSQRLFAEHMKSPLKPRMRDFGVLSRWGAHVNEIQLGSTVAQKRFVVGIDAYTWKISSGLCASGGTDVRDRDDFHVCLAPAAFKIRGHMTLAGNKTVTNHSALQGPVGRTRM